jgi:hypothetical protein
LDSTGNTDRSLDILNLFAHLFQFRFQVDGQMRDTGIIDL